jgi:hypothetical protein
MKSPSETKTTLSLLTLKFFMVKIKIKRQFDVNIDWIIKKQANSNRYQLRLA